MSGFIDPSAPIRTRITRLETLISEALSQLSSEALSPEAQEILGDLLSESEIRQERARRRMKRLMDADPRSPS